MDDPIFEPLKDFENFAQLRVDPDTYTVCWPSALRCTTRFVTGNLVGESLALLNGPATFIRRLTADRRSLDDVMRLAIERYSGERCFRPEEFQATASEIAGSDLSPLLHSLLATTEELDYAQALDWYGLKFLEPDSEDPERAWSLQVRSDATPVQRQHLSNLVTSPRRRIRRG